MIPHRVLLTKTVSHELSVVVHAADPKEAERLALELTPYESRDWTVVNSEVVATAEEQQ